MREPLLAEWDGEAFHPLGRHAKACDTRFTIGVRYWIDPEEPRNMAAHRAYFANLRDIWNSLPEDIAAHWPSPEHLRKYALCKRGYCHETKSVFTSHRDAVLAAAFAAASKDFAIVDVVKNVVRCWTPESQSVRSMGADRFKKSCADVIDFSSGLIGVSPASLEHAGEAAA